MFIKGLQIMHSPDGAGGGYSFDNEQFANFTFVEEDEPGTENPADETVIENEDGNSEIENGDEDIDTNFENPEEIQEESEEPLYEVNVGGQAQKVTLDQLRNGYMMQSAFTQKTQELAQQRQQLEQEFNQKTAEFEKNQERYSSYDRFEKMLQANPQMMQQFQEMMSQDGIQQPRQADPEVQKLQEQQTQLQQQLEQYQQAERRREVESEWNTLTQKYPDATNKQFEIATFADQHGLNLEHAYMVMNYGQVKQQSQQEFVKNNMRKKAATTVKPGIQKDNSKNKIIPEGNYERLVDFLMDKDFNLTE